jgi:hypothetical protein
MMKGWVEMRGVVQRKSRVQATRNERLVQTPRGLRLNPERMRKLKAEHREVLTLLAKNDGPVAEAESAARR